MRRPTAVVAAALLASACSTGATPGATPPGATLSASTTDGGTAPTTIAEAPGRIQPLADLPSARTEVAGTAWRGRLVVLGGIEEDGTASTAVHAWDAAQDAWTALPALPEGLHHTAVVTVDDTLLVLGGYAQPDGTWVASDRTWMLDEPDGSWEAGPPLPGPRGALAAVALEDGRLVVLGGVDADGRTLASTAVRAGDRWVAGPPLPVPTEHLAATVAPGDGGAVVVLGGRDGGLASSRWTAARLDVDDATVTPLPDMADARSGFGAATVGDRACVVGGEVPTGTVAPVACLDGDGWEVVATDPTPRHGLAVAAVDGRLHAVAGGPEPGFTFSAVHWSLVP